MYHIKGFPRWLSGKRIHLPMQEIQETQVPSLDQEDPLEEETATHSSILVGKTMDVSISSHMRRLLWRTRMYLRWLTAG